MPDALPTPEADPLYVAARRVLLDALDGLRDHLDAITLVGAQAVYIHAGEADLAVAPFTTDGDLAIDPRRLGPEPLLERALARAQFRLVDGKVGMWEVSTTVERVPRTITIDLLVPESLGGAGRRGARIPPHAVAAARKARGLEGALVDRDLTTIRALDPRDDRTFDLAVAGPSGLVVAKVHKMLDRLNAGDRVSDKDALDVYRLFRAISTLELVRRFDMLRADEVSRAATEAAIAVLPGLFGTAAAVGTRMALRAAGPQAPSDSFTASLMVLAQDLIGALGPLPTGQ